MNQQQNTNWKNHYVKYRGQQLGEDVDLCRNEYEEKKNWYFEKSDFGDEVQKQYENKENYSVLMICCEYSKGWEKKGCDDYNVSEKFAMNLPSIPKIWK